MWLSNDLDKAAQAHPTKYTKLILEAAQCLCSALHNNGLGEVSPYGKSYNHHPISQWAGDSKQNWFQLREYMSALHDHYYGWTYSEVQDLSEEHAYQLSDEGLLHKSVVQISQAGVDKLVDIAFPDLCKTARPKCVLDSCKERKVTESYRKYFVCEKYHHDWFEWSADEPEWFHKYKEKYAKEYRQGQFRVSAE